MVRHQANSVRYLAYTHRSVGKMAAHWMALIPVPDASRCDHARTRLVAPRSLLAPSCHRLAAPAPSPSSSPSSPALLHTRQFTLACVCCRTLLAVIVAGCTHVPHTRAFTELSSACRVHDSARVHHAGAVAQCSADYPLTRSIALHTAPTTRLDPSATALSCFRPRFQ